MADHHRREAGAVPRLPGAARPRRRGRHPVAALAHLQRGRAAGRGPAPCSSTAQEKDGFKVTARMIGKATSPRTRAVILNSPSNPTGAVIDPEDLLAHRRHGPSAASSPSSTTTPTRGWGSARPRTAALQALRDAVGDRFVVLGTASKSYCMTGWRIGWVLGPRPLVDACAALISHSTQCPATFAQVGAVEALTGPQQLVRDLAAEYRRRRDFIHPAIAAIPGVTCVEPGGGFYLFPNVARYLARARAHHPGAGRPAPRRGAGGGGARRGLRRARVPPHLVRPARWRSSGRGRSGSRRSSPAESRAKLAA